MASATSTASSQRLLVPKFGTHRPLAEERVPLQLFLQMHKYNHRCGATVRDSTTCSCIESLSSMGHASCLLHHRASLSERTCSATDLRSVGYPYQQKHCSSTATHEHAAVKAAQQVCRTAAVKYALQLHAYQMPEHVDQHICQLFPATCCTAHPGMKHFTATLSLPCCPAQHLVLQQQQQPPVTGSPIRSGALQLSRLLLLLLLTGWSRRSLRPL
jgi:hypothetical protein